MRALRYHILVIGLVSMAALQMATANERCNGLAPDAKDRVGALLDEAEMALDLGDLELANQRLYDASRPSAVVDIALDSECMGIELRKRFYRVRQRVTLASGKDAEAAGGKTAFQDAMFYYIEGDNRDDVTRLLDHFPDDPRAASYIGNRMRQKLDRLQYSIDNGHGLIADEQSAPAFYRARLDALIERSKAEASALLSREDEKVTGPITEQEAQITGLQENMEVFQDSLLNDESLSIEVDKDMLIATSRASQSQEMLGEARDWLEWIEPNAGAPVNARAILRGDALVQLANDDSVSLESRDEYYADAIRYYRFADAKQELAAAEKSREAIQPALRAERDSRKARMEQKTAEMKEAAMEMKRSMEMTPEEQESFKSEADSLEAELGF